MATALDLLMNTKEDVNLLSEESDICKIDAKTRAIFVPSTIVVGGVQSDKNAERIKFSCPKIVGDNLDLSKFSVRINFENVSSVDFNVSIKDQYICDDVAVDGENVTFSWLIGRNAARYMGTVRFIVCAVKTDSDSNISVEWNTAIAEVPVLEGIEIDQPQIGKEEKDVINQLLELTKNTSAEAVQNVNSAKEQAIKDIQSVSQPDTTLTIKGGLAEAKATGEAIGSLKEDISNKITKFYASSQGETNLADSDNGKIMDMVLYGKSEQKQYSGKNLINSDEYYSEYKQSDGTYKGKANVFAAISVPISKYIGTQITVSCKVIVPPNVSAVFIEATINGTTTEGNRIGSSKSGVIAITITPKTESDIIIISYGTGGSGIIVVSEFQIEKASETTSYEPYVGGQPSPSPDYPQEIKSVVNPTVKVCGKNLFGGKAFADKIVELGGTLNEANGKVSIAASVVNNKTVFEFPDESKSYTIILSRENTNTNNQATNLKTNKGICNNFVDRCSITTVTGAKKIFGVYDTQVAIYDYEKCGIFEGTLTYDDFEPYHEQTVTLPYTLNAIPVSSGGNVTIDGQQYVADYVNMERGKLVKMVDSSRLDNTQSIVNKTEWLLAEPQEIDLTTEEITAFKALTTYYPTTNISVNSEQLDGYTVFNYPISMQNGWNYVKQQLNDNRDYIYDMDIQSAEAYVNSEYAVALTELEV